MELKEIKSRLTIAQVLQHYGLTPDKNNRLLCPFHNDKTPSLQIYPTTNTFCCFSSNCNAGTGDAIQFIQLKESCNKHAAILKAKELLAVTGDSPGKALIKAAAMVEARHGSSNLPFRAGENKLFIETAPDNGDALERIAVVTKLFKYFSKALPLTKKAVDYLEGRAINYKLHEVGYNAGDWHYKLNEKNFIAACERNGLLKARPANGFTAWGKDCIIFPLKNAENKIVSLYGRSISNNDESRHFYLSNRSGLYPGYPALTTKKLILTESIIDAASLLQQEAIRSNYSILSLYGTNGLTEEHQSAIAALPGLEEIVLMLDADEAGAAATQKHYNSLKALLPQVRITHTALPAGEDINSVLQTHDEPSVLQNIIEERVPAFAEAAADREFFVSATADRSSEPPAIPVNPVLQRNSLPAGQASKLNSSNPELLIYDNCELYFEILGGIKITGLDRMKVTLKVKHKEKLNHPQWYSIDLYNQVQREQTINNVAETLELSSQQTANTFINLITELENHRLQKIEALQPKEKIKSELTAAQRQIAIAELKKPKLLERTGQLLQQCGIVGEQHNSLIAYLVYTVRKQPVPLHVMFLGSSGSGKTYLQERISELVPEEDKIEITQITENALYYFKQHELQNKLILIEDLDGAMTVFYPLRELQTKRRISKTVTLKDSKGNLKTITLTVEGPVCVSGCTTKEKIYEDNANRCILLYTDQGRDQDKRINEYQAKLSGGEINKEREIQYKELFKNMQRVLRPIGIINPYAKWIELPEQVFKPRRTMTLLLGFIEAVTFYHQYQREVKKDAHGGLYIETTVEDIEAAFGLLKNVLFSKSDELTKSAREFFEQLKTYTSQNQLVSFKTHEIRKIFRMEPRTIQRYMRELSQYSYIKRINGQKGRIGFEYSVADTEEYSRLKMAIDVHIEAVMTKIRAFALPSLN
jgi:DNA primase/energy-coupling factor transporter ATP-binding protein EcfA2